MVEFAAAGVRRRAVQDVRGCGRVAACHRHGTVENGAKLGIAGRAEFDRANAGVANPGQNVVEEVVVELHRTGVDGDDLVVEVATLGRLRDAGIAGKSVVLVGAELGGISGRIGVGQRALDPLRQLHASPRTGDGVLGGCAQTHGFGGIAIGVDVGGVGRRGVAAGRRPDCRSQPGGVGDVVCRSLQVQGHGVGAFAQHAPLRLHAAAVRRRDPVGVDPQRPFGPTGGPVNERGVGRQKVGERRVRDGLTSRHDHRERVLQRGPRRCARAHFVAALRKGQRTGGQRRGCRGRGCRHARR